MSKKIGIGAVLFSVVVLAGGAAGVARWKFRKGPVVATVGDYTLHAEDERFRNEVIRIYYPEDTRSLGLQQLRRAYTYAQILKNNGHPVTDEALKAEDARINRNTLMPEMLNRIKGIFGGDSEAYYRVYILPTLTERIIYYDFFLRDPKIQGESKRLAEKFIAAAKASPAEFASLAAKDKLATSNFTISLAEGLKWELRQEQAQPSKPARESEEGRRWIEDVIKPLPPGEVYGKVVDQQERWMAVRYLGPEAGKADTYRLEAAFIPKADFGTWLEREEKKISGGAVATASQ